MPIGYTLLLTQRTWQIARQLTWPLLLSQPLTCVERYKRKDEWVCRKEQVRDSTDRDSSEGVSRQRQQDLIKQMGRAAVVAVQAPAILNSAHVPHDKEETFTKGLQGNESWEPHGGGAHP